jgi:hypothetical protein
MKGPASKIVSDVCREYRNSDLRADNPEIQRRLNEHIEKTEARLERIRLALEAADYAQTVEYAALRTSESIVLRKHLESCREALGGKCVSVPDTVRAVVEALTLETRCKCCSGKGCDNCCASGCDRSVSWETRGLLDELGIDHRKLVQK